MLRPALAVVVALAILVDGAPRVACAQTVPASTAVPTPVPATRKADTVRAAQPLAPVQVKARYQKRPEIYNFMNAEPSSRVESVHPGTDWFDPLAAGDAAALLRGSPDMLIGADGSASLMGAPASANQLQINGMQVPAAFLTGLNGASITSSPWDVTIGGAAGTTVNLAVPPPRPHHASQIYVRSGVGGVPGWLPATGQARGIDVPVQVSAGSSGPLGRVGYSAFGFFQRENQNLPRWDQRLDVTQRGALDSLSAILRAPTINTVARSVDGGVLGRLDFIPFNDKRMLSLTSGFTRSEQSGGGMGAFATGSVASHNVQSVGLLQLESKRVLRERVLWESQIGTSIKSGRSSRDAVAPTIVATDPVFGNAIITGASPDQPRSRVFAADARSTATWYSRDNKTRYVAQLQVRGESARLGGTDPHATFLTSSLDALRSGQAIALTRESGTGAATARSLVIAPAIGARHDIGSSGSLLLGVRADIWTTSGVATTGTMQYVDISPRISLYQRLGKRSGNRGSIATLRVGAGRFTSWPDVAQWADAWTGAGATRESCAGADVPEISLALEAPTCLSRGTVQAIGRTIAYGDLRPAASNRADASLTFAEVLPGVAGEIGAALAHNERIAARFSPLTNAAVTGELAGDGGRALLVPVAAIGAAGILPVAQLPDGVAEVTQLLSAANSSATQWRVNFANNDPFQRVTWKVTYVLTTGRERSLTIASPTSAPGFVSGPLAAGGKHAFGFSLGTWLGETTVQLAGVARSGVRFTPLADRDLNGDGIANDAAFIPAASSELWANSVSPSVRGCVRAAAGRIAGLNSCTGPWSVTSLVVATIPGTTLGMKRGSEISLQISNPLAVFGSSDAVTFGDVGAINPTLVHITGFNTSTQTFTGQPLSGFGRRLGLPSSIGAPVRFVVGIRLPVGPSVTVQRLDVALATLRNDTSAGGRAGAAMEYLGDIVPVPLMVLQSSAQIHLTAEQRQILQAIGARWQATATRVVLDAYGRGASGQRATESARRARMLNARVAFFAESSRMNSEIRALLTPDQVDLLNSGLKRMLNPRFWKYVSLQDAGDI